MRTVVGGVDLGKIQLLHDIEEEVGQVALGQPLPEIGR